MDMLHYNIIHSASIVSNSLAGQMYPCSNQTYCEKQNSENKNTGSVSDLIETGYRTDSLDI